MNIASQFGNLNPDELMQNLQMVLKSIDSNGYGNFSGGTNAQQSGGGAIRPENLDTVIKSLTFVENQATFWKNAPKRDSKTIVTEAVTSELGSTAGFYNEGGLPATQADFYARLVRNIKFLGIQGKVTNVMSGQVNIADARKLEIEMKGKAIIKGLDVEGIHGNSAINPLSFDGILKQHTDNLPAGYVSQNVINLKGAAISIENVAEGSRCIADNFGDTSRLRLWTGYGALNELNQTLGTNKQFFVNGGAIGDKNVGYGIGDGDGLVTPFGKPVKINTDVFLGRRRQMILNEAKSATVSAGNTPPAKPAIGSTPATDGTGAPVAATASTSELPLGAVYKYYVCAVGADGISAATLSANITMHASTKQSVTITITKNSPATETGYIVWRLKNPSDNGLSEAVCVGYVPVPAGATVDFVDLGEVYDGSTDIFMLDWAEEVFRYDVLMYMQKFDIASLGDYIAWIQRTWCTPFLIQPRKMVVFKNAKSYALK